MDAKKYQSNMEKPTCYIHDRDLVLSEPDNQNKRRFYCPTIMCSVGVIARKDGTPGGVVGTSKERAMRIHAHALLDIIYGANKKGRREGFLYLKQSVGKGREEVHIAQLRERDLEKLIKRLEKKIKYEERPKVLRKRKWKRARL